ncbi:MAG TPA: DUF177 domain-containing protein [Candidatus Glassbacteria bacterium]|nr:DUF177 domain-containing protein [Candidatus Glassbacteria bacterium]
MSLLVIQLDSLKSGSHRTKGNLRPAALDIDEYSAFSFSGPLELDVRISSTDQLTFYASGTLSYRAQGECRKCLKFIEVPRQGAVRGVFALPEALQKLSPDNQTNESDDIWELDPGQKSLDLSGLVRECLFLDYPMYIQCSEDCRGLCPNCGADLNLKDCGCRSNAVDVRWAKLNELKKK